MCVIDTRGLTRRFGEIKAVESLDLRVPGGIIFGFLGPNGAGKTTTIRMLLGLLRPTCGSAVVLGHPVADEASLVREKVGVLLEHHGLYERLSARENLDYFARICRLRPPAREQRVRYLLESIGLWGRRDERVGGWSKGMKQKLAIARALVGDPELIFLDEPASGLDPVSAKALRQDLLALVKQAGKTVFLTTHNLEDAEKLCDQVGVVQKGRLLACDSPADLRARYSRPSVVITGNGLGSDLARETAGLPGVAEVNRQEGRLTVLLEQPDATPRVVQHLVMRGAAIEEVRREQASLEDVFLALTEEARHE